MNTELLKRHVDNYLAWTIQNAETNRQDLAERQERIATYKAWTKERLAVMTPEDLREFIVPLWAMRIWGNKDYVVNKLIEDNTLETLRANLAKLLWGREALSKRWDEFRREIKGMGPAMMSEILCYTHPKECLLWNRRVLSGLSYLEVKNLPTQNYQLTGARYEELCSVGQSVLIALSEAGLQSVDLLAVDYFIWQELQGMEERTEGIEKEVELNKITQAEQVFVHNDIRDKVAEIGMMLGFDSDTEIKVAEGSIVDAIWRSSIGNMGRVIYVFEVQTKGSLDSLMVNLQAAQSNPAVQAVVAVTDIAQIEKLKRKVATNPLASSLKYWDYRRVHDVHEALVRVFEEINELQLVPGDF